jgi:hypothetical protein
MPRIGKSVILNMMAKVIESRWVVEVLTWVHDVVSANGTVINVDVYRGSVRRRELTPSPEGYCVPLFDFKALDSGCFH